ncbi:DUF4365 domain-containing protein [Actinoplanes sp. NPDC051411]|uniref:DUF4365 domain-containing protein n=1 Tax=Actinoplanes sp. NPDC051411 TaxID=3155522 RepID=UPI00342E12D1
MAYFQTICSQAGFGFSETSPDEDMLAVDGQVIFPAASASVQVKCSSQFKISGRSASWPAEPGWRDKWKTSLVPVYFVLVILDNAEPSGWISHHGAGTDHAAGAFWTRVDQMAPVRSIEIPKTQRLTAETLEQWQGEVVDSFAPPGR